MGEAIAGGDPQARGSAGFQTCRIADFQIGKRQYPAGLGLGRQAAGLETRDTAALEGCATLRRFPPHPLLIAPGPSRHLWRGSTMPRPGATFRA